MSRCVSVCLGVPRVGLLSRTSRRASYTQYLYCTHPHELMDTHAAFEARAGPSRSSHSSHLDIVEVGVLPVALHNVEEMHERVVL